MSAEDLPMIMDLYARAYPGNWFDKRMLATGKYHGAFLGSRLAAIAGVHVYSKKYGVAALGNITTDRELRGKGLGASITAAVCEDLLKDVAFIGLNVRADNTAAIRCYEKIGFKLDSYYDEFMVTR
jgi:predicted GNAT family acetyltransferase